MKIVVIGAGAIGCFYGSLLAKAGEDVTFVARGETLRHLQEQDLLVHSVWGDYSMAVHAIDSSHLSEIRDCDLILLAVKSTSLTSVFPQIEQLLANETKILCLLNGIGNEERLAETFGAERVIGGCAFVSVINEGAGRIRHLAKGDLAIGSWIKQTSSFLSELRAAFTKAGVAVTLEENMKEAKWEKLLWNIRYNPITALTRTTVGEAVDSPYLYAILHEMTSEYMNVAASIGITFDLEKNKETFHPNQAVKQHKTSMLQDLEHGKKMELDALVGYVIKIAKEQNVPVPTIETIYQLLQYEEQKENLDHR